MPTTTLKTPRNSERGVFTGSETTHRVAPPGGGRKPPSSATPPGSRSPLSPTQALQSSVVVGISPPFRRNRPRPSWILATTRQPKPVRVSLGQAAQRGGFLWWGGHGVQALIPKACSLYDALRNSNSPFDVERPLCAATPWCAHATSWQDVLTRIVPARQKVRRPPGAALGSYCRQPRSKIKE